jgi:hypothetical protein
VFATEDEGGDWRRDLVHECRRELAYEVMSRGNGHDGLQDDRLRVVHLYVVRSDEAMPGNEPISRKAAAEYGRASEAEAPAAGGVPPDREAPRSDLRQPNVSVATLRHRLRLAHARAAIGIVSAGTAVGWLTAHMS